MKRFSDQQACSLFVVFVLRVYMFVLFWVDRFAAQRCRDRSANGWIPHQSPHHLMVGKVKQKVKQVKQVKLIKRIKLIENSMVRYHIISI